MTGVASKIESILAVIALPVIMIYTGTGFKASFLFAMHNLHNILPAIIILVFIGKTLFNFGQRTETR